VARAAPLGRLTWLPGELVGSRDEAPGVRTLELAVPGWPGHRGGQHVDLRLTAEDGYQAVRSYSLAAPAANGRVELTVERLEDGEVSPYLVDEFRAGDRLELRGPIGGYFVWDPEDRAPLMLIGGGSGVVPLAAMLRERAALGSEVPARLLYSAGSAERLIYREELDRRNGVEVSFALTREQPPGWRGFARRVDAPMLAETVWPAEREPAIFVCGPTAFVEAVAELLVGLGHRPGRIRTERFGPTGRS
jgi:ferredoxin-NADP reductase